VIDGAYPHFHVGIHGGEGTSYCYLMWPTIENSHSFVDKTLRLPRTSGVHRQFFSATYGENQRTGYCLTATMLQRGYSCYGSKLMAVWSVPPMQRMNVVNIHAHWRILPHVYLLPLYGVYPCSLHLQSQSSYVCQKRSSLWERLQHYNWAHKTTNAVWISRISFSFICVR